LPKEVKNGLLNRRSVASKGVALQQQSIKSSGWIKKVVVFLQKRRNIQLITRRGEAELLYIESTAI